MSTARLWCSCWQSALRELAQGAIEEAAMANILRPFLQHLQPVEYHDQRMCPQQGERGLEQVVFFARLWRPERSCAQSSNSWRKFDVARSW